MHKIKQLSLDEALGRLAETDTPRSVELFRHGSLLVKWYAPRGTDQQQPHTRDEIYVVARGGADFVTAEERMHVKPGDFLFAAARIAHRFENMSGDLGLWVFFYGPEGGEMA